MGRHEKVTAQEIREMLEEGQYTKFELAEIKDVTIQTIGNKIRQLRDDGDPIIHNQNGMLLLTREDLSDEEIADAFRLWIDWWSSVVGGMMICAKPVRPLLPALRKALKESMDSEERKILGQSCIKVKGLLDYIETTEEDEE